VRVNCRTREVKIAPESEVFKKLGGRALTSKILLDEVNPACDPLGSENKLIIAGMLLAGTTISTCNRISVGTKSPLTGGIKESNVVGTAGWYLASHGIKALILEDAPIDKKLHILHVKSNGEISLVEAEDLTEKGNYETVSILRERYGPNISIMSIGPAGERGYFNSSIMVTEMGTEKPCRAAGRGGVGAVMGSKGVKAIVIEKPLVQYRMEMQDPEAFKAAAKEVIQSVLNGRGMLSNVGTVGFLGATIPMAIAPYRNFNGGAMTEEEKEKFNVNVVVERIRSYGGSTGHGCQPGCVVKCSNIVNDKEGNYLTAGLEYETVELFGPNCGIFDMEVIARIDRFCDDFGFDTIELGVTLGVYMESGKLPWSDGEGALKLFNSFYERNNIADDFGMGAYRLGKKYGVKRIPAVKKQALAAYEPMNL